MAVNTITDDLAELVKLLDELDRDVSPARLELSIEDGIVTAQVMADRVSVPLVGRGADAPDALRDLLVNIERAKRAGARRRRRKRR